MGTVAYVSLYMHTPRTQWQERGTQPGMGGVWNEKVLQLASYRRAYLPLLQFKDFVKPSIFNSKITFNK